MALPYRVCSRAFLFSKPQQISRLGTEQLSQTILKRSSGFSCTTRRQLLAPHQVLERLGVSSSWVPFHASRLWVRRGFRTRRPRQELEQVSPAENQNTHGPSLFKPFLYTVAVVGGSFMGAMILNYEKMRMIYRKMQNNKNKKDSNSDKRERKVVGFRDHLNQIWANMNIGQKVVVGIMAANLGVFMLWKVPGLQSKMVKYFSSGAGHPLLSMTLSSFSHISFFHLFVNMYVLWSFASVSVNMMGFEQFAAFYLSAGTVSSFMSIACAKLLRRPFSVSVGASGAIMGLIGCVCVQYPNAQLSIAFISEIFPHSFSADSGMKGIIAFDLLGLLLGWRMLDHAGHLGGMLFGLLYTKYGNKLVWGNRESIMKWWHNLRGKP